MLGSRPVSWGSVLSCRLVLGPLLIRHSSSKRPFSEKWDKMLQEMVKPLNPRVHSEFDLARTLEYVMSSKVLKQDTILPVRNHFVDLVAGLEVFSNSWSRANAVAGSQPNVIGGYILSCQTEQELQELFNQLLFKKKLSSGHALSILTSKLTNFVDHIAVVTEDQKRLGWSSREYTKFRILLSLKSFRLGNPALAWKVAKPYLQQWDSLCLEQQLDPKVLNYLYSVGCGLYKRNMFVKSLSSRAKATAGHATSQAKVLQFLYIPMLNAGIVHRQFKFAVEIIHRCKEEVFSSQVLEATHPLYRFYIYIQTLSAVLADYKLALKNPTCASMLQELSRSRLSWTENDMVRVCMSLLAMGDSLGGDIGQEVRTLVQQYVDESVQSSANLDKLSVMVLLQKLGRESEEKHSGEKEGSGVAIERLVGASCCD